MRQRLRIRLLLLLALAPRLAAAQALRCADSIITGNRVGVIQLGMSLDSVRARCTIVRDTTQVDEGGAQRVIYALVAHDTVRIDVDGNSVRAIDVRRPGYVTMDSIRVGMPLSRFLFGRHPMIEVGEGKVFLIEPSHCGLSFGLSSEAYERLPQLTEASLARLPSSTVIDEIFVRGLVISIPNDC